tara:strand:+ start:651 stop:1091 length:441 start_codon:yes stop_codon:yes gene_type:complete
MSKHDEIEKIKQLKARYLRFLDTRQWIQWRELFTEDVVADYGNNQAVKTTGVDLLLEMTSAILEGAISVHHAHTPEIILIDESHATGIWAMEDIINATDYDLHGFGYYHETYIKVDGYWKICRIKLTRLKRDLIKKTNLKVDVRQD